MKQLISFSGAHGTGKSSAVMQCGATLKKHLYDKSITIIEENAREIARYFGGLKNSLEFNRLCMIDHLHKEFRSLELHDITITDRTVLDTLVYAMTYQVPIPAEYYSLAMNHMKNYSSVVFVRPDSPATSITNDGFRDTDLTMRNEIDKMFEKMLSLTGVPIVELRTKDISTFDYLKLVK